MKFTQIGVVVAFGLCISIPGLAEEASSPDAIFAEFDLNKDSRLTFGEISDRNEKEIIEGLDRDKNGWVSPTEFAIKATGRSLIVQGGIDDNNIARRWIDYTFVRFELGTKRTITIEVNDGQFPIDPLASDTQVEAAKIALNARFSLTWPNGNQAVDKIVSSSQSIRAEISKL